MLQPNDTLRITKLIKNYQFVKDGFNKRKPKEGDVAVVIEVYAGPPEGYLLECRDHNGKIIWQLGFAVNEVEWDKI